MMTPVIITLRRDATDVLRMPVAGGGSACDQPLLFNSSAKSVADGVQYWSCENYGFVWATHNGEALRSASPRKPARQTLKDPGAP
jgi:hypothetical protein